MKLLICPKLSKIDIDVINQANLNPEQFISNKILKELGSFNSEFVRDHVYALGWMIANKKLEIKIALKTNLGNYTNDNDSEFSQGIFHQKVGIFNDNFGNTISFSGSINESANGWLNNIEEFKVFRSWINEENDYLTEDKIKFNNYWNNLSLKVKSIDISNAIKLKLIEIAPKVFNEINLNRWYKGNNRNNCVQLFQYQEDAINAWIKNGYNGIFEMATGTGKTFTALGCVKESLNSSDKLIIVISCPFNHLINQWKREIDKFKLSYDDLIIADGTNKYWIKILTKSLIDIKLNYKKVILILTTHTTFSSKSFKQIIINHKYGASTLLIADEVHGLGAEKNRSGLLDTYDKRLGLSATPKRWFDEIGTENILKFFGDVVFEFSLEDAINKVNPLTRETYLTPYRYIPYFVSLNTEELEDYIKISKSIFTLMNKNDLNKSNSLLEILLFKRADITKNADNKYNILDKLLNDLGQNVNLTLIYCSPKQIDRVMNIVTSKNLVSHRFTMDEGTTPHKKYFGLSQRDFLLKGFADKKYQILVAMKCLDEGVDVPGAKNAILLASSGNPREYIQRIGRVLRRFPNKTEANIFDIIVTPSSNKLPKELVEIEKKIFKKELVRCIEIAKIALNSIESTNKLMNVGSNSVEVSNE